jgi:ATP-dependent RNA helicase DeaD
LDKDFRKIQAIILTPTRELAIQIADEIKSFAERDTKIQLLYGGQSMWEELRGLKREPHIVV